MKQRCLFCASVAVCLILGCQSPLSPQPERAAAATQSAANIDPNLVELADGKMERGKAFRITAICGQRGSFREG